MTYTAKVLGPGKAVVLDPAGSVVSYHGSLDVAEVKAARLTKKGTK